MSGVSINQTGSAQDGTFNAKAMLLILGIGSLAFILMLVLGAYAPNLNSGRNSGTHALSNGATGFSGLVRLAAATGRNPVIIRSMAELDSEDLAIITPDHGSTDLTDILANRGPRATLVVLPKWDTSNDQQKSGWVRVSGLLPADDPEATLAPDLPLKVSRVRSGGEPLRTIPSFAPAELHFAAPKVLQTISGRNLEPLLTDGSGRVVLGRVGNERLYVLADADLLNNHGMGDRGQAAAALALLDFLNSTGAGSVLFDVTANGLGQSRSPLKLAFDPPFLGVTLTIFVAMLLAGWQALVRFGPVRRPERAIAFGKTALADNSAALIRRAGRESRLGHRYAELIREQAMHIFKFPRTLAGDDLDVRLEALNPDRSFATAAGAAAEARNRGELLVTAKSLHQWLEEARK